MATTLAPLIRNALHDRISRHTPPLTGFRFTLRLQRNAFFPCESGQQRLHQLKLIRERQIINGFFTALLEQEIPRDQWDSKLREIARLLSPKPRGTYHQNTEPPPGSRKEYLDKARPASYDKPTKVHPVISIS